MQSQSEALDLKFYSSDLGKDVTIRDYLHELLLTLWNKGESFSGKRPFGNSGWETDLFIPLIKAGYVKGTLDEDGYLEGVEKDAPKYVQQLIHFMCYGGK